MTGRPPIGPIGKKQDLQIKRPHTELMDRVFPKEHHYGTPIDPIDTVGLEPGPIIGGFILPEQPKQDEWDDYFMSFARLASVNSKCGSRKIGAALVVDKRVVATGYNGPPQGMDPCSDRYRRSSPDGNYVGTLSGSITFDGDGAPTSFTDGSAYVPWPEDNFCPRRVLGYPSGQGLDICVAAHAERNALLQAARLGIRTKGGTLYCWCGQVCKDCAIEIVNAGISELVFLDGMPDYDGLAGEVLAASGIKVRRIDDHTDDVLRRA